MLHVTFRRVDNADAEEVSEFLKAMEGRADEVAEALRQETSSEEVAYLLPPTSDHVLIFASWLRDPDQAARAFTASRLPVDVELKAVLAKVSKGPADVTLLCKVTVDHGA